MTKYSIYINISKLYGYKCTNSLHIVIYLAAQYLTAKSRNNGIICCLVQFGQMTDMIGEEKIKERVKEEAEGTSESESKTRTEKLKENLKESAKKAGSEVKEESAEFMRRLLTESKTGGSTAGKKVKELAANIVVRGKDTANALGAKPDLAPKTSSEMAPEVSVDLGIGRSRDKARKKGDFSLGKQEINFMEKDGKNKLFDKEKNIDYF